VPLAYTLAPHNVTFEGLVLSLSFVSLISFVTAAVSIAFIIIGKKVSNTPHSLTLGIIGYALIQGFIGPFWLMRSLSDVLTGTKRKWR